MLVQFKWSTRRNQERKAKAALNSVKKRIVQKCVKVESGAESQIQEVRKPNQNDTFAKKW